MGVNAMEWNVAIRTLPNVHVHVLPGTSVNPKYSIVCVYKYIHVGSKNT